MFVATSETTRNILEVRWDRIDRHRSLTLVLTLLALALIAAAATMAVVGLPPIDLHGPLHKMGIMDPLCGGTRAARYTAQGQFGEAWRYNPLGIVVVAGSVLLVVRAMIGVVGRRWLNVRFQMTPRARRLLLATFAVLLVLLEIRQQARAGLLMAGASTPWW